VESCSPEMSMDPGLNLIPRPQTTTDSKAESATNQPATQKPVDIIFVHGLGGDALETWTYVKTGAFWPQWLYDEQGFENVRSIFSFGYIANYAKLWEPANVLGIGGFARQLLGHLRRRIELNDDVILFTSVRVVLT